MRKAFCPTSKPLPIFGLLLALLLAALGAPPPARAAAFTEGNLVVYRVGAAGGGGVVDSGNPVFLDEFTPAGSLVQSLALPTADDDDGNRPVLASNRVGEGLITRTVDGRALIVTGFSATALGLPGTTGNVVPRVIARVEADGTVNSSTSPGDFASTSVPSSAASTDGFNFWAAGGAGGLRFTTANSTTSTLLVELPTSLLQAAIFDGQLYLSRATPTPGIGTVGSGTPTTGPQTFTPLPGLPTTGTPFGFFFADLSPAAAGVDTLYVAYDNVGLSKFTLVGGSWTASGTVGGDADDYRGLAATVSGQSVALYATRKAGELVSLVDASGYGGALAGTPGLLASAPAGTAFRGVALAPRGAAALAPDLTVEVSGPAAALVGEAYSYALRVRNSGVTAAPEVIARFTLPPGLRFVGATGPTGFSAIQASGVVTFTGGSLLAGGQADLLVSVAADVVGPVTVLPGAAVVDPPVGGELDSGNNSSLQTVVTSIVPAGDPPGDTNPPNTMITDQPAATTSNRTASFSFTGEDDLTPPAELRFQCSLDGAAFGPCTSPQGYVGLALGDHSFQVRAVDAAGNADPTPAAYTWTIVGDDDDPTADTTPPETTISAQPDATTFDGTASFSFTGSDEVTPAGALLFECSLDGAAFAVCTSPRAYASLAPGPHSFQVRAVDARGNVDPTPATYAWTGRMRLWAPLVVR